MEVDAYILGRPSCLCSRPLCGAAVDAVDGAWEQVPTVVNLHKKILHLEIEMYQKSTRLILLDENDLFRESRAIFETRAGQRRIRNGAAKKN